MKNLLALTLLFFTIHPVFSQENKISIINSNIEPVVESVQGISAEEAYSKVNEWINYNYRDSKAVIGSSVNNEFIRFTGVSPGFAKVSGYVYDLEYTLSIEFKDNRYRLTVEDLRSGVNGVFANFTLAHYYKKDGSPKNAYKNFTNGIESTLNGINTSIYSHLNGLTSGNKDDW